MVEPSFGFIRRSASDLSHEISGLNPPALGAGGRGPGRASSNLYPFKENPFFGLFQASTPIFHPGARPFGFISLLEIRVLRTLSEDGRFSKHIMQGAESPSKRGRQSRESRSGLMGKRMTSDQ